MGSLYSAHDALVGQPCKTDLSMGSLYSAHDALVGQPQSQTLAAPNTATATGKKKKKPGTGKKKKKSATGRHAIKNAMENDGDFARAIRNGNRKLAKAV